VQFHIPALCFLFCICLKFRNLLIVDAWSELWGLGFGV
jgi:hypothetical protein